MMPVIPGLTDAPAAIESVVRAARRAGASAVWWRSLFLKPSAARRFIPFIKEHFPEVAGRIDEFYARAVYAREAMTSDSAPFSIGCARSTALRWIIGIGVSRSAPHARDGAGHTTLARRSLTATSPRRLNSESGLFTAGWTETLVRGAGLEPARYFYHEPLKLACLPFHHPRTRWPRLERDLHH